MKLGYTIIYVPSVESSLRFFNQAFGLQQKFLHESGDYGELNTGVARPREIELPRRPCARQ
jgi:lactoylglutathione lyase